MARMEPTAEDSLADIFARSRFGIAMAAMIKMMATTISSSMSEKPTCLRIFEVVIRLLIDPAGCTPQGDVPLLKKNGGQLHSCVSFSRTRIRIHADYASGSH